MRLRYIGYDLVEMFPVGIGNENLSERVGATHYGHNTAHTPCVELIENIIEKQQRPYTKALAQKFVLCKPQRRGKCLCLTLRRRPAQRHPVERELYIIAMRPRGRVAEYAVASSRQSQMLSQATFGRVVPAGIAQAGLLIALGDGTVVWTENFLQPSYIFHTSPRYVVARNLKLGFECIEQREETGLLYSSRSLIRLCGQPKRRIFIKLSFLCWTKTETTISWR